jgi:putative DNA primase/helicase
MRQRERRPGATEAASQTVEVQADATAQGLQTDAGALRYYLHACYGDGTGVLVLGVGSDPHLTANGKVKHRHWSESTKFDWPNEADKAVRAIIQAAAMDDAYVCPYLMRTNKRAKGNAVTRMLVHADVDNGSLDADKVQSLGGFAIASGTPGNGHAYVPLMQPVSPEQHEALCRGLGAYLGAADAKVSDNDVLRPPGTFNYKPTVHGGEPVPVTWLVPFDGTRVDPETLALQLVVNLDVSNVTNTHGEVGTGVEPVKLDGHPRVHDAIKKVTGDRSVDTSRIVGACVDAYLSVAQTRWCVAQRQDLQTRLDEERHDDDVLRLWVKLTEDRQPKPWSAAAKSNEAGAVESNDSIRCSTTESSSAERAALAEVVHSAQLGMAVKMGKRYKNKLLYVHPMGWHRWDGRRWAKDADGEARRAVHNIIKRERAELKSLPMEDQLKRSKEIARFETASAITGILTEATVLQEFSVTVADVDVDPWLFNCANGTLDLRTMELHGHNPADRITKVASGGYHPGAESELWNDFLATVLPNNDVRAYWQRLNGLALLGKVNGDKEILPIATGDGANGKTTAVETVSFAMGDYAQPAEPELLMVRRNDAHPTGIADLLGKRLVTMSETKEDRRFDIATMKRLTGGDKLKARFMRQDFFEFDPSHLLIMYTNHLPRVDDDTPAVWRRIRVIRFGVEIPQEQRDEELKDRLQLAADAVLTWLVEGWKDYRVNGMRTPQAVMVETERYKGESDAIGRFIKDECLEAPALSATTGALYDRYLSWAARENLHSLSKIAFGRALDRKGFPVDQNAHGWPRRGMCPRSLDQL